MKNEFLEHIAVLQEKITTSIEKIDGEGKFIEDIWKRPEGGGGKSRVMENGKIFEKAGVNTFINIKNGNPNENAIKLYEDLTTSNSVKAPL